MTEKGVSTWKLLAAGLVALLALVAAAVLVVLGALGALLGAIIGIGLPLVDRRRRGLDHAPALTLT